VSTDTFVTAVEIKRLAGARKPGTLRFEHGQVAFEGPDGRKRFSVPAEQVSDVAPHRAGYGFWVTIQGRRYFVIPRNSARPGAYSPLFALVRPITTMRYLWWKLRSRRKDRELTRQWVQLIAKGTAGRPRGLHGVVRIPLRAVPMSFVMLAVPARHALISA
jgi:hypothetical protein